MNEVKTLSIIYTIIIWIIVALILSLIFYRIYNVFIIKRERQQLLTVEKNRFLKIMKILFGVSMLSIIIIIPFYVYIGSAFKSIIPNYLNHLLVFSAILLAALEAYLSLSISKRLINKKFKKVVFTLISISLFPALVYFANYIPEMFTYPAAKDGYIFELPVKGTWLAGHAGGSEIVNYHCLTKSQKYAIDIVKLNGNFQFFQGKGKELTDFCTMGENIYSPANGMVVNVVDSLPNAGITFMPMDTVNPAGNHAVIEFEQGRYIFLAHLDKESVQVYIGDTVKAGDLIAKAGNSGNTSWPHLHMHVQDKPILDYKNATGLPFRFKNMERKRWLTWTKATNAYLIRNDLFRNK